MGFIDHTKDSIRFDTKRERNVEVLDGAILKQVGLELSASSAPASLANSIAELERAGMIDTPDDWIANTREEKYARGIMLPCS